MPLVLKEVTLNGAPAVHSHPDATTSASGFMTAAMVSKLNALPSSIIEYVHPTNDGNLHVPATSTTNNNKFLQAGNTAGTISWATISIALVDGLQAALDTKAPVDNPAFTGTVEIKLAQIDGITKSTSLTMPSCASLGIDKEGALRIWNHKLYVSMDE